jgi:DNA repair exonuclease SbcCD ATPase subunit
MTDFRSKLDKMLSKHSLAREQARQESKALSLAEQDLSDSQEAQKLLQEVAEAVQRVAHDRIASVVSRCLEAVFGSDSYGFKVDFRRARGKTEARLLFTRNGEELDPVNASGGGVVDVASFALRCACLVMSRPQRRRLLVLDEPFHNVNGDTYRRRVAELLPEIAKEMGIQIVMATGYEWLEIGKVVRVGGESDD